MGARSANPPQLFPDAVSRRITLERGLNILWARPRGRAQPARLHARGLFGHATGKTTFCRFVRHLLGENNFGTDEQRARLRHVFPEAWLVGEVHLASGPAGADEPWVVARPFKTGAHPFVMRGHTLDALFSETTPRLSFNDYLAALETLKIICFDLAALISSVEGQGQHPRFLLHDGPREADMDAELYQRLFLLAKEIQEACGESPVSFQYIITTTEPPPAELQTDAWLLDPVLDASTKAGKLLGDDF